MTVHVCVLGKLQNTMYDVTGSVTISREEKGQMCRRGAYRGANCLLYKEELHANYMCPNFLVKDWTIYLSKGSSKVTTCLRLWMGKKVD